MSGAPSEKTRRAPGATRVAPISFLFSRAKTCARTTPASELRSATPIPCSLSAAAFATNSSGCDAPRRNEKLVIVASSAKRGARRIMAAASSEQPVHVPSRPPGLATVEAFAIEPEAAAFRILGAEIIAGRPVRPAPPFGGDALGALDGGNLVHGAPPFEAQGRSVRNFGDRLDRLGAFEEAQGTGGRCEAPRAPSAALPRRAGEGDHGGGGAPPRRNRPSRIAQSRRNRRHGEFGNMRVDAIDPRDAARAEPRAQPVQQIGERLGFLLLRRARQIALRGRERLGEKAGEA